MKTASKSKKPVSIEKIAKIAVRGGDVSRFFTNDGRMMKPGEPILARRVNVDFAPPMLVELDDAARELNISRQAVIKTLVRQALNQNYLAAAAKR